MSKRAKEAGRRQEAPVLDRRSLLKAGAGAALAAALPAWLRAAEADTKNAPQASTRSATEPASQGVFKGDARKLIWGNMLHMSVNCFCDRLAPDPKERSDFEYYIPELRFDEKLWDELTQGMAAAGMNLLLIDLGDAVQYESHPEIAVKNAWTAKRLKTELARLRKMGLEPIPFVNFSTTHNAWLGRYRHMVSSDKYCAVARDLIAEVCSLFDKPRFFHLGMDEENVGSQQVNPWEFEYIVVRRGDLWWHDFLAIVGEVEKHGVRPWIWSDSFEGHRDEFVKRMPKSVLQSWWYYSLDFSEKGGTTKMYRELARNGYDEIPTGSNWYNNENFGRTVDYCSAALPPERLLGFLQTAWRPTTPHCRPWLLAAIEQAKAARENLIATQSAATTKG